MQAALAHSDVGSMTCEHRMTSSTEALSCPRMLISRPRGPLVTSAVTFGTSGQS